MNLKEIDSRLEELNTQLKDSQGRTTEVYSRIVGYYRSVKNWNKGKKEEFGIRKTFQVLHCTPQKSTPVVETEPVKEIAPAPVEESHTVEANAVDAPMVEAATGEAPASESLAQGDLFSQEAETSESLQYRFYFRKDCPNCPPMKQFVETLDVKGDYVDVDQEEGLQLAVSDNVYTAPTVILFNEKQEELFRTDNVPGLEEFLAQNKEAVSL